MKVQIVESFPGEALDHEKVRRALRKAYSCVCSDNSEPIAKGRDDAAVDALLEIERYMVSAYNDRMARLKDDIVSAVRGG